ncbi:MAG: tRNA (adenosine(37)-N6)-threonylcarbamoyltransferase complex dimerization subunit type 1 TsaB, partial [Alphaproteobacteria bacterium]|nr:tRNA (adenosine(37)-N6)-threonylcarbamoyltransferase complex dimerization subunit type 1 TsaB [Alphaproteobacteria bacterium]
MAAVSARAVRDSTSTKPAGSSNAPGVRILALDTALAACSAAIWCAGRVAARRRDERGQAHAEALLPMIAGVLKEAGIGYRDLDALAVTIGPGSFTGLRIGLATARGLSLALGKPIIGVGTLEAVAEMAPFDGSVLAVLDARRGEVYAQIFGPMHQPLSAPQALTAAAAAAAVAAAPPGGVVIGSGAARVWPFI